MSEPRWLHKPTGTVATYVGEDRDTRGAPYAVMETDDGERARIDPLDLVCVPSEWELLRGAPEPAARDAWPPGISDGLTIPCSDCGEIPRFDYHVDDDFWRTHVPESPARLSVVCLPCLDRRCGGVGLAAALRFIQWTGTGHTVELVPSRAFTY